MTSGLHLKKDNEILIVSLLKKVPGFSCLPVYLISITLGHVSGRDMKELYLYVITIQVCVKTVLLIAQG